ncbi:winged helix DNA-binding domain-containing protein [Labedaea rhizosphaerae]|nr:winged helix DNA-binding domain-containing protein [Labedaea rhizosphaerae]
MSTLDVDRAQVMAYRIAATGLHRDQGKAADLAVLDIGVQQTVPGSVATSLAARLPAATDAVAANDDPDFTVAWTYRGAAHLMRTADLPALARDLWPVSEDDAIARLAGAGIMFRKTGIAGLDAWRTAATAMRKIVKNEMVKGDVSTAITKALPDGYGYACRSCKATHIYGSLFQAVALGAGVQVRSGSPTTLAPVPKRWAVPKGPDRPDRAVRPYLHVLGPATMNEIAAFLGTTQKLARTMLPDDAVEVRADGRKAYVLESDVDAVRKPPEPDLVRLLPPFDPLLQPRERELIVPDEAQRKNLWRMIGNPGAIVVDGDVLGAWKAKLARKRLAVTVEEFVPLPRTVKKKIEQEADRVAVARGIEGADVSYG